MSGGDLTLLEQKAASSSKKEGKQRLRTPTRLRQLWDRHTNNNVDPGNSSDTSSSSSSLQLRRRRRSDWAVPGGDDSSNSMQPDPLHLGRVASNNHKNNGGACLHMSLTKKGYLLGDPNDESDFSATDSSRRDDEESCLYVRPPHSLKQGLLVTTSSRKSRSVTPLARRRLPFFHSSQQSPPEFDVSESEQSTSSCSASRRPRGVRQSLGLRSQSRGHSGDGRSESLRQEKGRQSAGNTVVTIASSSNGSSAASQPAPPCSKSCLKQRKRGRTRTKSSSKKKTTPRKIKSVSFASDDSLEVRHESKFTPEDLEGEWGMPSPLLWYGEREIKAMKEAHSNLAKTVGQAPLQAGSTNDVAAEETPSHSGSTRSSMTPSGATCGDVFKALYKACCKASKTSRKSSSKSELSSPVLTSREEAMIEEYYAGCSETSLREIGLEHSLLRSIHKDAKLRREKLMEAIFLWNAQQYYQWNDSKPTSSTKAETPVPLTHESQVELRKICERITRPSRLFAGCVAYAQISAHS